MDAGAVLCAFGAAAAPDLALAAAVRTRQAAITAALPGFADLLSLALSAGLPLDAALRKVAAASLDLCPALGTDVRILISELALLPHPLAFTRAGQRCPALAPLTGLLADSAAHGLALGPALKAASGDMRDAAIAAAEQRAAQLPPKLSMVLVVFFLPVVFVVVLGPPLLSLMTGR